MEGIQPTMPIGNSFGNDGLWLFAILALMGGGFGYGNRGNVATQDDLNFARLENQVRANAELTERKADAISNGICSLGYTIAEKFGQTDALIIAENQKTRDLMQQNKIEQLQAKINQLELSQALCGVVRYPSGFTYNAGSSPFCNCGGFQNNI